MTAAWLVHIYTASGAVLGLLSLVAVTAGDVRRAFLWLFVALVVDATDGWLARRLQTADRLPSIDGAGLDNVVDYVTYVFVPAYLIHATGLLPAGASLAIAGAVLLASAYGFSRTDAKTADHFFTGFPSYWNVVALYLYLAQLSAWLNAAIVLVLCGLVFWRIRYVYPSRMPVWRAATLAAGFAWAALVLWLIWRLPDRSGPWLLASLAFPVYYAALSFVLTGGSRRTA